MNIVKIYHRKGKIFWILSLKSKENLINLNTLKDESNSIYPIDWEEISEGLFKGGLRRCIYTAGDKDYAEDFIKDSFKLFENILTRCFDIKPTR
jgi:hypothetical protein